MVITKKQALLMFTVLLASLGNPDAIGLVLKDRQQLVMSILNGQPDDPAKEG